MQEPGENSRTPARRRSGHAVIEVALLAPWIFFLFIGAFDMGFYAYSIISVENAARVAALYTSSGQSVDADAAGACRAALAELNSMNNVRGLTSCNALPVIVTASEVTGVDGAIASQVAVTYQTEQLIPFPGLMGRLTLTRVAQMRVKP